MEKIDNIEELKPERCKFMDAECEDKMLTTPHIGTPTAQHRLKWCQNCLMGKLIEELRRLRLTGIQP